MVDGVVGGCGGGGGVGLARLRRHRDHHQLGGTPRCAWHIPISVAINMFAMRRSSWAEASGFDGGASVLVVATIGGWLVRIRRIRRHRLWRRHEAVRAAAVDGCGAWSVHDLLNVRGDGQGGAFDESVGAGAAVAAPGQDGDARLLAVREGGSSFGPAAPVRGDDTERRPGGGSGR